VTAPRTDALELWGGIECTVNRIGDRYIDQLESSGHAGRDADLDLVAGLGIRTLRYPVLWEKVAPEGLETADWSWADRRLSGLHERGINAIVGLLHHGSGPRYTSLIDSDFPAKFAEYAGAVAKRYPWITLYTPINEPLTTARFSALYGHWFPHERDDRLFGRAVINQLLGTRLAMEAIREVNPGAALVQTEDIGKTHSTPLLDYQARFENERRWLTFDVLCGRFDHESPMWRFLHWAGVSERELETLRRAQYPPAILGVNHYVTSERYLDERLDRYPAGARGGNQRHAYADVEAVRVLPDGVGGPCAALLETWRRYGVPVALTETHIGATREDQLRWLDEAWRGAEGLRAAGVHVRAVAPWSLFGAFDWHSLVTRDDGRYEPGAFDVRVDAPRRTALATMIRSLATTSTFDHPVLHSRGWWRRPSRLYSCVAADDREKQPLSEQATRGMRPIVIAGAAGTLGRAFARVCEERGLAYRACTRQDMDIVDGASIDAMLDATNAWAVVNAAGYVRVDDAERARSACFRDNCEGAANLASACEERGLSYLTFSSDLVFDGQRERPYVERDAARPLNAYGRSKAAAERAVLELLPSALVVRTSAFFGPWDEYNFVAHVLRSIGAELPVSAPSDEVVSPTFVPDLVHASLDLLIDGERGIWHLANDGAVTWADLARLAAQQAGLDPSLVNACPGSELCRSAPRPRYSALSSERGRLMPPLDDAVRRYIAARPACVQTA
jgi:dTDP-4-dehydrorhamnose reductase